MMWSKHCMIFWVEPAEPTVAISYPAQLPLGTAYHATPGMPRNAVHWLSHGLLCLHFSALGVCRRQLTPAGVDGSKSGSLADLSAGEGRSDSATVGGVHVRFPPVPRQSCGMDEALGCDAGIGDPGTGLARSGLI